MNAAEYFYNPDVDFEFVSDSMLWNSIFSKPFPRDLHDSSKGTISLSHFFEVKEYSIHTERGMKYRKLLSARERYFSTSTVSESDNAFLSLCSFLQRFNRPFRECYIRVPHHPTVEQDEKYLPLDVYYRKPKYPCFNEQKDKLRLILQKDLYDEVHQYSFGCKFQDIDSLEVCALDFSFQLFCGFLLHY